MAGAAAGASLTRGTTLATRAAPFAIGIVDSVNFTTYNKLVARPALSDDEITAFRARLTQVATRLFAEKGFEGVTLRAVAAELGVSPMTPYRYVADKEELLALVRTEAFRRFADEQEAASKGRGDAVARLRRLGRAYVRFALEHPDEYRMMFELRQPQGRYPELGRESARGFSHLRDATTEAVADGSIEGDPLTAAHLLWATTHGLVTLHLAGKLSMGRGLEELAEEVVPKGTKKRRKA